MRTWQLTLATSLAFLIAWPLSLPLVEAVFQPAAWGVWQDGSRLLELSENTLLLVAGTLALAMPLGIAAAVLLYRSDLPLARAMRFLVLLTLFVPLPLLASAWQAALGSGGWLPAPFWNPVVPRDPDLTASGVLFKPWGQGLGSAIFVHALAGLPWVIWLTGQALRWVEREMEEDALLDASPWKVLWRVTLPRCRAALLAAGLWVAVQTATEITVTDVMRVRTFAEEVYTQFVSPDRDGGSDAATILARAVMVSLPLLGLTALLVLWAARRCAQALPPLQELAPPLCLLHLGKGRWLWLAVILILVALLVGIPVASLVWKAGLHGRPETWSVRALASQLLLIFPVDGPMLLESLLLAALTGVLAAGLALVACWLMPEARWLHAAILILLALAWAMPGPILGIGLKSAIDRLLALEETLLGWLDLPGPGPLRTSLYDGPSLLPVLWVGVIRYFPFALAIIWPVVRLLPVEYRDAARLDGARPRQELLHVVWPLTRGTCLQAALAVAVLSLGELSAGKLVETPGAPTFAHEVFNQMHYGVTSKLAALCLVLLLIVTAGGCLVAWGTSKRDRANKPATPG